MLGSRVRVQSPQCFWIRVCASVRQELSRPDPLARDGLCLPRATARLAYARASRRQLPLRGSVWLTLGVLPVVVRSAFAGAVVWLAPVTECLAVWLGRCRVRCALCLLPPRILASSREACVKPKR